MNKENRVEFERPDFPELTGKYTVVDLHYHTRYSDGASTVGNIVKKARELGIGIAITDHNEIKGAVEIDKYKDVLSIPGIEITSKEGTHILVYFYDIDSLKKFYKNDVRPFMGSNVMSSTSLNVEEVIRRAGKFRTIIIFPHPYSPAYTGVCNFYFSKEKLSRLFSLVDGVEVINSENLNRWNMKSTVLGFNLSKTISGGSDGHAIEHMGRAVTCAQCENNREAFLDSLKANAVKVVGKEIDIFKKVTSNSYKLKTNINNCPDLVEKNLRYGYAVIQSKSRTVKENVRHRMSKRGIGKKIYNAFVSSSYERFNHNFIVFFFMLHQTGMMS
ncbi:MAG: PHP domain-containing protein [Deltaproteobacteria bacterium]|nr:PHP domain-containing protein [Deltaproteobacteria bacterium]